MGVGVSNWKLARAVSLTGQLGVVSGTAMTVVLCRRLQLGDADGTLRRAFAAFPYPEVAKRIWDRFFVEGGLPEDKPFAAVPMPALGSAREQEALTVLSVFCEVFLAKEDHSGVVGLNLLEKIQVPTVPSLYGAMLAGVDVVLMGAGIPKQIPGILDALSVGNTVKLKLDVTGEESGTATYAEFDPAKVLGTPLTLKRPFFLAIVSSSTLALNLAKKSSGKVDGFVVEGSTAGGHNAPPRGQMQLNEEGEPIYGARDVPDLNAFRTLGVPFWLAGGYGRPDGVSKAQAEGARGIQVGTAFAVCEESGLTSEIKEDMWKKLVQGQLVVRTDPKASPTGFPFKVVEGVVERDPNRVKVCDLGFLREAYCTDSGRTGFRCPAEDEGDYVRKGGCKEDTEGRRCVCNGLLAAIGLGQRRADGQVEEALLTAGNDLTRLQEDFGARQTPPTAAELIALIVGDAK